MFLVVVLLCWGVKMGIDIYTHHGEKIKIPDVRHKLFADAEHILNDRGLQIVVSDTGYVKTLPPTVSLNSRLRQEGKLSLAVWFMSSSTLRARRC